MSKRPTYRSEQEDFEKYFGDGLSEKERHGLESHALEDAFEAEAMDGWEEVSVETAQADLTELREKLQPATQSRFNWLKIAAAIALLVVASVVVLNNINNQPEMLAQDSKAKEAPGQAPESAELKAPAPIEEEQQPAPVPEESLVTEDVIDTPNDDDLMASSDSDKPNESLVDPPKVSVPVLQPKSQVPDNNTVAALDVSEMEIVESDAEVPVQVLSAEGQDQGAVRLRQDATGYEVAASDYFEIQSKGDWSFRQIQGNVMDENGQIVSDARIVLNGTSILAVSDFNGNFEMAIPDSLETPTLTFSSVGFNQLNYEIDALDTFDVVLARDEQRNFSTAFLSSRGATSRSASSKADDLDQETNETPLFIAASPVVGNKKYEKYLKKNTRVPEVAKRQGIKGTVLISFQVSASGQLSDFKVVRGLGAGCDEEAIRVIKEGPSWKPASSGGEAVPVLTEVAVKFN